MLIAGSGAALKAQDIQFVSTTSFASMQNRVGELEGRMASFENLGGDSKHGGKGGSWGGSSGLVGGLEVAFLRVGQSDGGAGDYDFEAAPRIWLGYQNANGLGARVRWFHFDADGPNSGFLTSLRYSTIDFEITDTFQLGCKWEGTLSGGLRLADYHETFQNDPTNFIDFDSGVGAVVGVELNRRISDRFGLFGLLRGSIILADGIDGDGGSYDDVGYSASEMQLGAEYHRAIGNGCTTMFARVAAEAQYLSGVSDLDNESITLIGGAFSVGISR
jgi:hypothetical protein